MVHTVHLIDSGVLHRLENISDDVAHDIMKWWAPSSANPAVVPEYFQKTIKNEQGQMTRALLLRRGGISAIDIVPVPGSELPAQPVAPTAPVTAGTPVAPPAAPPTPPVLAAAAPTPPVPAAPVAVPTPLMALVTPEPESKKK